MNPTMTRLVLPKHPRMMSVIPRVCQVCGEHHPEGTPTPSGRKCSGPVQMVKRVKHLTDNPEIKPKRKAIGVKPPEKVCKRCGVTRDNDQYASAISVICIPCRELAKSTLADRKAEATKNWYARNRELVAERYKTSIEKYGPRKRK